MSERLSRLKAIGRAWPQVLTMIVFMVAISLRFPLWFVMLSASAVPGNRIALATGLCRRLCDDHEVVIRMLSGSLNELVLRVRDHFGVVSRDMEFRDHMEPRDLRALSLASVTAIWIAASERVDPSVGTSRCLNIRFPLRPGLFVLTSCPTGMPSCHSHPDRAAAPEALYLKCAVSTSIDLTRPGKASLEYGEVVAVVAPAACLPALAHRTCLVRPVPGWRPMRRNHRCLQPVRRHDPDSRDRSEAIRAAGQAWPDHARAVAQCRRRDMPTGAGM